MITTTKHSTTFAGGSITLELDEMPEPEMLPAVIEPLMRAAQEIGNALETERRESEDEKGDDAEGAKAVERRRK